MKRLFLIVIMSSCFLGVFAQEACELGGAIQADSVQISRSGKRKERREAALRKQSRMLIRDLIEQWRLQFEPEVGFYHGNQINMNAGHYTKTGVNSLNEIGSVSGWHEDQSGGKYSGKPMLQIIGRRFYCNLEPIISTSRAEIIGTSARDAAMSSISSIDYDSESSEETLKNWRFFDTEYFKIQNIKELGDYMLSFDIVVNQFNIINNTPYNKFIFQCVVNVLDARMTLRIVAGDKRACATYFGYMNVIRGGSF